MGKPESSPPGGQSVEQLLSSIRTAIEADSRLDAQPTAPAPPPGAAPAAPPVRPVMTTAAAQSPAKPTPPRISVQTMVRPQPQPVAVQQPLPVAAPPQAESRDDEPARDHYHAANPYRFRYSLEGYIPGLQLEGTYTTQLTPALDKETIPVSNGDENIYQNKIRMHQVGLSGILQARPFGRQTILFVGGGGNFNFLRADSIWKR